MKNTKALGTDGLTVESFVYAYSLGELSIDQKRGIIKLLPKKDKILQFLKNWRPISLLNTDYKIIAHLLANRLQNFLQQ